MKTNLPLIAIVTAGLAAAAAAGLRSPSDAANAADFSKTSNPADSAIRELALAGELAQLGRAQRSATALLAAAEIVARTGGPSLDAEPTQEAGGVASDEVKAEPPKGMDLASLLADARKLSGEDAGLRSLADRIEGMGTRGGVNGPGRAVHRVLAHSTDSFTVTFVGGQTASVMVSGDGDTDLDLYVYDENGNLIGQDTDLTDQCLVSFTPRWTGPFKVRLRNLGGVYNQYVIAHN